MPLTEFLHARLFENADYLFPCAGVIRLTLNRLNCKCDPVTVIGIGARIDFDHTLNYAAAESLPHHEIGCFSCTPLGARRSTSIVLKARGPKAGVNLK